MSQQRVPILCYHRVISDDDPSAPPVQPGVYCGHIMRSRFERQMHYLAEQGCSVVTHAELVAWLLGDQPLHERAVLIDFDDNRLSVFENAYPVLRSYGWPATVFVISSFADGTSPWGAGDYPAMGWKELAHLADAGWLIGAHTCTHPWLDVLYDEPGGPKMVEQELIGCRADIEAHLGVVAKNFAYPAGRSRPEVERIVARHYESARLWNPGGPFIVETNFGHPTGRSRLECEWDPKEPFLYNTKQTSRYRLEANNICELTDDSAFQRLIDDFAEKT